MESCNLVVNIPINNKNLAVHVCAVLTFYKVNQMNSPTRLWKANYLLLASLVLISACSQQAEQPTATENSQSRPAKLLVVGQAAEESFLNYPATVKAENVSALSFEVSGVVDKISVVESQSIQQGDVLATLDTRDLQASLQSAQAQFDNANSEFQRAQRLIDQDAISKSEFEQRRAQRDVNKAQLDTAQKGLQDAVLIAPFSGNIAEISIKAQQAIQAGSTAMTILGSGEMEATINLPSSVIALAQRPNNDVGGAFLVFSFAPDQRIPAVFKEANLSADTASQTYKVTFTFGAPDTMNILPGMNASLWFPDPRSRTNNDAQILLPLAAIGIDGDQKYVWLVNKSNSSVTKQIITVQDGVGEMLVVTDGLELGDTVVAGGISAISAGMKVHPWSK